MQQTFYLYLPVTFVEAGVVGLTVVVVVVDVVVVLKKDAVVLDPIFFPVGESYSAHITTLVGS